MRRSRLLLPALLLAAGVSAPAAADDDPARIIVFPSHGRPGAFTVHGRVLEDEGDRRPGGGAWHNVVATLRALETDEIEGAVVEIEIAGRVWRARTDDDGIWRIDVRRTGAPLPVGPLKVRARLVDGRGHPAPPAEGVLHVLADGPGVGVITDFDDTVAVSHVTDKLRLVAGVLTRSATRIEPVRGAAEAFRRAARAGAAGFVYLSASPHNLIDRVTGFLRHNGFPSGAVLLRNFGEDPLDTKRYKLGRIREVLRAHPGLRFVLVGDSGEADPEIYARIRGEHPGRIAAIVIRRVPADRSPPERFAGMVVVDDFARAPGLIAGYLAGGR